MQILEKVKLAYDIPIVTDVHETIQVFYFVYFRHKHTMFVWSFV